MSKSEEKKATKIKPSGGVDWIVFFALLGGVLWGAHYMNTGENAFKDINIAPGSAVEMIYVPVTFW